jgi:EmrB/QacA subfamily drug resistance transporter
MAAPESDRLGPDVWKVSAVALFGTVLSQLDATIVNVSLTNRAADLHTTLSTIQWVISGYLLALTLVLPLNGWLVDRVGARAVYLWCFTAFTLSSALCGFAWSAGSLIGFRVLQGVSGGLLAPMAQMMIARAAGRQMARVVGYIAAPVLLAPVLGPIIAGAILQHASWRWLFLVNLPVGAIAILLAFFLLPSDSEHTRPRKLDWVGLMLLSPGLTLFLYGSDKMGETVGRVSLAVGVAMMAAFLWTARKKGGDALVDLRLFKARAFSTAAVTQFLANGGMFAGQMLIPAFLIAACGRTPAEMGWMLAPQGLGMMVIYPSMGRLTKSFGIRLTSAGGALLAGVATLAFVWLATAGFALIVLVPALILRGMGMSAVGVPSMTAAYATVDKVRLPMATTSINIVQRLGGPTMTTLAATFLAWRLGSGTGGATVSAAYAAAFLLLAALHLCAFMMAMRLPRRLGDVPSPSG